MAGIVAHGFHKSTAGTVPSLTLSAWMEITDDLLESAAIHVRIDLRRLDVGVSQHFLDHAQVGAAGEQMRRKGMTKRMRMDIAKPRTFG